MRGLTDGDIAKRFSLDNPWWRSGAVPADLLFSRRRLNFTPFFNLLKDPDIRRAVVLMGPRRVGKTVLIRQAIDQLLKDGAPAEDILYLSLDTPVYTGLGLEKLLRLWLGDDGLEERKPRWVFFDEVQYLRDWERHLKSLVDVLPHIRFAVSGSAAAALRMKSTESGAGRFTDFLLPPLSFAEYLHFIDVKMTDKVEIEELNRHFFDYINFGGFPEVVLSPKIQDNMERFVREDILDKVLLRDLPSLYGIDSTQDLNRLFSVLAYNSGEEISYDTLSQTAGMAKNTLRKYIDYLEAAFLIIRLPRIDQNAKRFKRETHFKVYLTNPCIRAALFGPVGQDDPLAGAMVETAFAAQLRHLANFEDFCYARWKDGEVDFVLLDPVTQKPKRAIEIKWSDRYVVRPEELNKFHEFCDKNNIKGMFTTKTIDMIGSWPNSMLCFVFSALPCVDPALSLNAKHFTIREETEAIFDSILSQSGQ